MWLLKGQYVYFSKALSDVYTSSGIVAGRYEECFPPGNSLDFAPGSEIGRGMLSDGFALYIGTERHIRRITGDDPTSFSTPNVIFSETGLLNQNSWNIVFREGTPIGCMWVTPDFRVVHSDFNTYNDVGTPVQAILNSTNVSVAQNAVFANFVGYGAYNYYALFLPTGVNTTASTALIFDLHTNKWYVWQFPDGMLSSIFYFSLPGIPRWLAFSADGTCRYFDPTIVVDKQSEGDATPITSQIQTSWLTFGDQTMFKVLNNVSVLTADPNMTLTVEAAQNQSDFLAPTTLVNNVMFTPDIFNSLKVMLVGQDTTAKYFRLTFTSTSNAVTSLVTDDILDNFSISFKPISRN